MSINIQVSKIAALDNAEKKAETKLQFIPAKIKTELTESLNISNFFNNYTVKEDDGKVPNKHWGEYKFLYISFAFPSFSQLIERLSIEGGHRYGSRTLHRRRVQRDTETACRRV